MKHDIRAISPSVTILLLSSLKSGIDRRHAIISITYFLAVNAQSPISLYQFLSACGIFCSPLSQPISKALDQFVLPLCPSSSLDPSYSIPNAVQPWLSKIMSDPKYPVLNLILVFQMKFGLYYPGPRVDVLVMNEL